MSTPRRLRLIHDHLGVNQNNGVIYGRAIKSDRILLDHILDVTFGINSAWTVLCDNIVLRMPFASPPIEGFGKFCLDLQC